MTCGLWCRVSFFLNILSCCHFWVIIRDFITSVFQWACKGFIFQSYRGKSCCHLWFFLSVFRFHTVLLANFLFCPFLSSFCPFLFPSFFHWTPFLPYCCIVTFWFQREGSKLHSHFILSDFLDNIFLALSFFHLKNFSIKYIGTASCLHHQTTLGSSAMNNSHSTEWFVSIPHQKKVPNRGALGKTQQFLC